VLLGAGVEDHEVVLFAAEPPRAVEVVELRHERSRALDPHKHRHLWLNVKVQGVDGKWSRIDSRVAMRFQNVVNAEGDLAARTDPRWLAVLAAKGYTVDPVTGEVTELAHLVRPLSRRAAQIDANRAVKLAEWRDTHPGMEPSPRDLAAIDRWAWSYDRPDKPHDLDEAEWAATVRSEITDLDPAIGDRPARAMTEADIAAQLTAQADTAAVATADVDELARVAVTEADRRAAANGGRFSAWDVRAGAVRAVASLGVAADRDRLAALADEVAGHAARHHVTGLLDGDTPLGHVKAFMAADTATMKTELEARLVGLAAPGRQPSRDRVAKIAARVLEDTVTMNAGQADAAAAIASTDRLVTVTGPAGTGKTTLLRVAAADLAAQRRRLVLVAPTKKAAAVAGRETQTTAGSVHSLLLDHGWIAEEGADGRSRWRQLQAGELFPDGEHVNTCPSTFCDVTFPSRSYVNSVVDAVPPAGVVDVDSSRPVRLSYA